MQKEVECVIKVACFMVDGLVLSKLINYSIALRNCLESLSFSLTLASNS